MHQKVIYPDDHEELLRSCGGHTFSLLNNPTNIKEAASAVFSRKDLADMTPPPGHFMAHVIGLGDFERFGWNRNGDAFMKSALEKYTDTFVTHGHLFREHRNRDPKTQGLGVIKAARYNPEMGRSELVVHADISKCPDEFQKASAGEPLSVSMSCFPAGTKVRMTDGTSQTIETLQCGQQVVTHQGNSGTVTNVSRRDYDGKGIEVKPYGVVDPIRMTADHPVWVRPKAAHVTECPVCGGRFKRLKTHLRQQLDDKHQAAYRDLSRYCEGFKPADQLLPGDWLRIPVSKKVSEVVDPDKAWLLGVYLAEGHIYEFTTETIDRRGAEERRHTYPFQRLDLTFGSHEVDLAERARSILQRHTANKVSVFKQKGRNVLKVRLTGRRGLEAVEILAWLKEHGGHLGGTKRLSQQVLEWDTKAQKRLVEGWLDGDGSWHRSKDYVSGTTISEVLAGHFQQLLSRCGIPASINSYHSQGRRRAFVLQVSSQQSQHLDFCRKPDGWSFTTKPFRSAGHLRHQEVGRMVVAKAPTPMLVVDANGHLYARIRSVKTIHLQEPVYDLTVPGDHGFVAGGIGVSNCRVPKDRCSCCGHLAKRASEYCHHAGRMMNRWVPQFQKYAYVFNDDPTFFDISWVARPADRIAHYLGFQFGDDQMAKAASADDLVVTGSQWAEYEGVNLPEHEEATPLSDEQMGAMRKLASEEAWLEACLAGRTSEDDPRTKMAHYILPTAMPFDALPTDQAMQTLRTLQPGTFFRKMASRACLLSYPAFTAYVTGRPVDEVAQDGIVKASMLQLPSLFRNLLGGLESGGCCSPAADLFQAASPVTAACDQADGDPVQTFMDQMTQSFGAGFRPVKDRSMSITVIKRAGLDPSLSETVEPDEAMLHAYGLYKVAAMLDITRLSDQLDTRFLPLMIVAQNRAIEG